MLDPELSTLAQRLVVNKRSDRNEALRHALRQRQSEAASRGILGAGFYASAQRDACIEELRQRAQAAWEAYRRVISSAKVPWSPEVREDVLESIRTAVENDISYLEDNARDVILPHGHSFDLFLRNAWPDIFAQVTAEVDLFALQQRPARSPLANLLAPPRYAGPLLHWRRSQEASESDPSDDLGAAREAVHMVEGLARVVTAQSQATLGECVKWLRAERQLPSAMAKQLEMLWGYSSNLAGMRHGAPSADGPSQIELQFVLESAEVAAHLLLRLDVAEQPG